MPSAPGLADQDAASQNATSRANQNNSSSIAGHINSLLLTSRETLRADMATIADMVGSSIGITRNPGESDGALAARFVAALANLSDSQRAALQKQLNQVLKGLQVQVLLQVLQNQDGPEAALLSAYMEIQRSNSDNLKAQTVVSSYNQNAESLPSKPTGQAQASTANSGNTPAAQPSTAPQTSIAIAVQASIAGAKDKEDAIAKLATALRQASPGTITDYEAETGATASLPTSENEVETKTGARIASPATTDATTGNAKPSGQVLTTTSNAVQPQTGLAAGGTPTAGTAAAPVAEGDPQAAQQPAPQATATSSPASREASSLASATAGPLPSPTADATPRPGVNGAGAQTATVKDAALPAAHTQTTVADEQPISKEAVLVTALSMKGWVEAAALAPQALVKPQAAANTELFRQMFFQTGEFAETAEASALRALANRQEAAQNADLAKAKIAKVDEPELDRQSEEKTAPRTQAVLTLAGAQAVQAPIPSQIVFPLAVPLPLGTYLAMQQPPELDEIDQSVDAIDALSDEEPRQESNHQHHNQDEPEDDEDRDEADMKEDGFYAMNEDPEPATQEVSHNPQGEPAQAAALLAAPQDEPAPADSLYWKIADLA